MELKKEHWLPIKEKLTEDCRHVVEIVGVRVLSIDGDQGVAQLFQDSIVGVDMEQSDGAKELREHFKIGE